MVKDEIVDIHIAESKAKIEKAAPETVEAERCIDRTQHALARSRRLLEDLGDPFELAKLADEIGATAPRPSATLSPRVGPKPKRRR